MVGTLTLRPVKLRAACAFVRDHHRHHGPPRGHLWSIGLDLRGQLVGVAIIGRPLARLDDDGFTFEVLRVCTLGHANACSMLYGAAWRSARAMGCLPPLRKARIAWVTSFSVIFLPRMSSGNRPARK